MSTALLHCFPPMSTSGAIHAKVPVQQRQAGWPVRGRTEHWRAMGMLYCRLGICSRAGQRCVTPAAGRFGGRLPPTLSSYRQAARRTGRCRSAGGPGPHLPAWRCRPVSRAGTQPGVWVGRVHPQKQLVVHAETPSCTPSPLSNPATLPHKCPVRERPGRQGTAAASSSPL